MLAIVCSYILENDSNRLEKILSEIKNEQIKSFFADEKNRIRINNLFELVNITPTPENLNNNVNTSIKREVECPK